MRNYNKVLIATPIRGNQTITLYTAGMLQSTGLHGGWLPLAGQSDVYVARNVLMNEFMRRTEFDTMVGIDSDVGFTRENLQNLIDTEEDFVSGLYTDKCQPPMPFCRDNNGMQVPLEDIPKQGLLKARFIPGGFFKIERRAVETLIAKGAVPSYGKGAFHHFYNGRIAFDNLLSEDYSFSDLVWNAGIQPWINCGIRLSHDGRTLDPQAPQPKTDTITTEVASLSPPLALPTIALNGAAHAVA
jgi:hypothetical protein